MIRTFLKLLVCAVLLIGVLRNIVVREDVIPAEKPDQSSTSTSQLSWISKEIKLVEQGALSLWGMMRIIPAQALVGSLGLMGFSIFLGALRWQIMLKHQGLNLPIIRVMEISLVAQFFNSFLLGASGGDVMKAVYVSRETHQKKVEAVGTVMLDRVVGLLSMIAFAVLVVPFQLKLIGDSPLMSLTVALTSSILLLGLSTFFIPKLMPQSTERLIRLATSHKSSAIQQLGRILAVLNGATHSPLLLVKTSIISFLTNLLCVAQFWILSEALNMRLRFTDLALIVPLVVVISAIPITPSGLGVREQLFVNLLSISAIGALQSKSLSLSLVAFGTTLVWSVIGGGVYLAFRDSHNLRNITEEEPPTNR